MRRPQTGGYSRMPDVHLALCSPSGTMSVSVHGFVSLAGDAKVVGGRSMRIGVPREIKNGEHRVAMTPEGVACLVGDGHVVLVERHAGRDVGYDDDQYREAGAYVVPDAKEVWQAELVVKVKEPLPPEFDLLKRDQILFTYLHLAAMPEVAEQLVSRGVCAIGYETVQTDDGRLPLLAPMSRVAGRVAMQLAAHYLQLENDVSVPGRGILFGGLPEIDRARVAVLGAGNAGEQAVRVAAAMGAEVRVLDQEPTRLAALESSCGVRGFVARETDLTAFVEGCDVLIGAILVPGGRTPRLIGRKHLRRMNSRSVFVDIAIDQGGVSETSHPTSYDEPVYVEESVIHCALPNLPACVARSSTQALTRATLPYLRLLAGGLESALDASPELARGVNVRNGRIVHERVRQALEMQ